VEPVLLRVEAELEPEKPIKVRAFSAKIVKRMLAAADPSAGELFQPIRGSKPKLMHVTPLYAEQGGKVRTVLYTSSVEPGRYTFYVGALDAEETSPLLDAAYSLAWLDTVSYAGTRIIVRVRSVEKLDISKKVADTVQSLARHGRVKLVLASPTVLRDPLVSSKHKTLVPSVMNLLSTPVYISLYSRGRLRYSTYMRTLVKLHRALTVPPTFLGTSRDPGTLRRLDLTYEPGRRVPTLIGYINLHYNPENDPSGAALELLKDVLPHMLALGTGVGRAAGLGHVDLQGGKPMVGFSVGVDGSTMGAWKPLKPAHTETHRPE
jgi:hypothetical protein